MEVARGEGEIDPNQQENQVGSSPHGLDCWRAARGGQQAHAAAAAGDTRKRTRETGDMAMGSATGGYLGYITQRALCCGTKSTISFVSADCLIRRALSGVRTRQKELVAPYGHDVAAKGPHPAARLPYAGQADNYYCTSAPLDRTMKQWRPCLISVHIRALGEKNPWRCCCQQPTMSSPGAERTALAARSLQVYSLFIYHLRYTSYPI